MKVATQDEKKVLLNFQKITETDSFLQEIKSVRKKLDLPEDGFKFIREESKIKLPEPDEKTYHLGADLRFKVDSQYPQTTKSVISLFPVMNNYLSLLIRNYIYYNEFLYDELESFRVLTLNACRLMDAEDEADYFLLSEDEDYSFSFESHNNKAGNLIYSYPISIRIRSDVSQNTLIDFIKKNWEEISSLQKIYQKNEGLPIFKNSKTKQDNFIKERNQLIIKNRNLPRKEIMHLIAEKFGSSKTIDVGTIGKIISLWNKKSGA